MIGAAIASDLLPCQDLDPVLDGARPVQAKRRKPLFESLDLPKHPVVGESLVLELFQVLLSEVNPLPIHRALLGCFSNIICGLSDQACTGRIEEKGYGVNAFGRALIRHQDIICCVTLIPRHCGVPACTPHSSGYRKPCV
jgi:hypothetical protein